MPKFLINRWHGWHIYWMLGLLLVLIAILAIYEWVLGVVFLIPFAVVVYYAIRAEREFRHDFQEYVLTLSHRIKRAGNEVIHELPIGILLYDEEGKAEWHNPFVGQMVKRDSLVGEELSACFSGLAERMEREPLFDMVLEDQHYRVIHKAEDRLLYFLNITEYAELAKRYEEEKLSLGIVMIDNLDEVTQHMDDQARSLLQARVVSVINTWANEKGIYLRRITADKFLMIMNQLTLKKLEQSRFDILDIIRDLSKEYKLPLTVSLGVSAGTDNLIELGQMAQASLDIALGRGGDQAAVRVGQRLSFYGGRSNAIEKRTRVRARVISHAMRDLMKDSDQVIVMGHRAPDMDAVGAAIGIWKAAQLAGRDAYIIIEGDNPGIARLMEYVRKHEPIVKWIISPEEGLQVITPRTLVVVVDTHKPSMVAEPRILQQSNRIMVIDHHRRGEEFLDEATLIYMEPYASSTGELVTELLEYFQDNIALEQPVATALLVGIVVDTKSFSLRTGSRTFEAASFLRRHGADTTLVQNMMKEDLDEFVRKGELIRQTKVVFGNIALAVAGAEEAHPQVMIAKTADTLLDLNGIEAAFVIANRTEGGVGISARSLGSVNVQIIMEQLGGGGHLSNAAAQLDGTVEEAEQKLMAILRQFNEEGRLIP